MPASQDLRERLLTAFRAESAEQLADMRRILSLPQPSREDLEEAFRHAHSMKGGARVCDLADLENAAHDLESELAALRDQPPDALQARAPELMSKIDALEDLIEQQFRAPVESRAGGLEAEEAPVAAAAASGTVRITTEHLDHLLAISGDLIAELLPHERIGEALEELNGVFAALHAELLAVRDQVRPHRHAEADAPVLSRLDEWRQLLLEGQRQSRRLSGMHLQARNGLRSIASELSREITAARLVAARVVFEGFGAMVREIARGHGREIRFEVEGLETMADRSVLQSCKDPVMHLLRNAVVHGIEPPDVRERAGKPPAGTVRLLVETRANRLHISVEDDGGGIPLARIRSRAVERGVIAPGNAQRLDEEELLQLIFHPGLSTAEDVTEFAGRGMGLSVVEANVRRLGGSVAIHSEPGKGTKFDIETALSISAQRLILVQVGDQRIGVPAANVARLRRLENSELRTVEGTLRVDHHGQSLPVASLADLLGITGAPPGGETSRQEAMILRHRDRHVCALVHKLREQREAVVHELDGPAALPMFSGAAMMESGALVPVLHVAELFARFRPAAEAQPATAAGPAAVGRTHTVLVVDDSFTTRTLERSILEAHGYRVFVAVDGVEALGRLRAEPVDLVISDIQMPRMDGFNLVTQIKADPKLKEIPVVLVSSMEAPEDQERGLAVGAEAYIVKRKFDHQELIETIRQLL